jgi:hypothetical protein
MRWGTFILLSIIGIGCASKQAQPPVATAPPAPIYDQAVAAALVFDPPVLADSPQIDFSREGRAQSAYAGFEELTTTFYYLQVDDRQQSFGGSRHDRFERQAITQRVGVSYR